MSYEPVKNLKPEDFKRLCGVRQETFRQMVVAVEAYRQPKLQTARPGKLSEARPIIDDMEILEGVQYLLPHWSSMGSKRVYLLQN